MEKNIQTVLKSLTGYDEEQTKCTVLPKCTALFEEMEKDDLISKLVRYGMNSRFDGMHKTIRALAKIRKRVYRCRNYTPVFFVEFWVSRYREIKNASAQYLKYADNGFKDAALQCVRETVACTEKIRGSGSGMIPEALDISDRKSVV